MTTPWFDPQAANTIGTVLGVTLGAGFGGIGGGIGGPLAALGKAKPLVLTIFYTAIALGIALAITGLTAIFLGQPRHVWLVFLFPGTLVAAIMGGLLPVIKKRYKEAEARKLAADQFRAA